MRAVVIGSFMYDGGLLRPSPDPTNPLEVDLDAPTYRRQASLGNVQPPAAYRARYLAEEKSRRARADLDAETERLQAQALAEAEVIALREELEALGQFERPELINVATMHGLTVARHAALDDLRATIRKALETKLAGLETPAKRRAR